MKKLCVFLCIALVMASFSVVVSAQDAVEVGKTASLSASASAVYFVPSERECTISVPSPEGIAETGGISVCMTVRCFAAVDKYTPEIMEQINIISVAPRE